MVHALKDTKTGGVVTTKCGLTGKGDKIRTSGWTSQVTCHDCLNPFFQRQS